MLVRDFYGKGVGLLFQLLRIHGRRNFNNEEKKPVYFSDHRGWYLKSREYRHYNVLPTNGVNFLKMVHVVLPTKGVDFFEKSPLFQRVTLKFWYMYTPKMCVWWGGGLWWAGTQRYTVCSDVHGRRQGVGKNLWNWLWKSRIFEKTTQPPPFQNPGDGPPDVPIQCTCI
jgi:hypothetical protein